MKKILIFILVQFFSTFGFSSTNHLNCNYPNKCQTMNREYEGEISELYNSGATLVYVTNYKSKNVLVVVYPIIGESGNLNIIFDYENQASEKNNSNLFIGEASYAAPNLNCFDIENGGKYPEVGHQMENEAESYALMKCHNKFSNCEKIHSTCITVSDMKGNLGLGASWRVIYKGK